jgi:hypothetical protein
MRKFLPLVQLGKRILEGGAIIYLAWSWYSSTWWYLPETVPLEHDPATAFVTKEDLGNREH